MSTWLTGIGHRETATGIVHCSPWRGGLDDPRSPSAILHSEPYASADLMRSLGRDLQVSTVRGCVGLLADCRSHTNSPATCIRRYARRAPSSGRQHRLRGETTTRPRRARWDDSSAGSLRPAQSVHEGCSPNNRRISTATNNRRPQPRGRAGRCQDSLTRHPASNDTAQGRAGGRHTGRGALRVEAVPAPGVPRRSPPRVARARRTPPVSHAIH